MKSRRKKQLARLNTKKEVQGITLQQAWDRVCEEFDQRNNLIYFVEEQDELESEGWILSTGGYQAVIVVKQSGGKN
ncbi:hypothetical protein [Bacillus sp. FDAARGOS_1420]|uniref:hypothetical protein n=1 Tax=unclassified Bacillus (in: firmicutes) TaxID=185979 RepID=UPI001C5BC4C5|nr:hypothetical protein [Bacillus sp. FDAARGOS_1420]MBW3493228.1 hypothetical protein [Bacillus sp. FDAARGOS_1420]